MGGRADKGIGNVRAACADELQVVSHKSTKWKRFCENKKSSAHSYLKVWQVSLPLCFMIQATIP